jgi:biopolymer transport protein ExbD
MNPYFKRSRIPSVIPTASMADIAFMLIIFFMLTTVFTATRGIEYGLPKNEPITDIQPRESIYIYLRSGGGITVDGAPVRTMEELAGYIQSKMEETGGKKPVIIRTDPSAPYGRTVEVLDLLKLLKVKNISIPTQSDLELWKDYFGE